MICHSAGNRPAGLRVRLVEPERRSHATSRAAPPRPPGQPHRCCPHVCVHLALLRQVRCFERLSDLTSKTVELSRPMLSSTDLWMRILILTFLVTYNHKAHHTCPNHRLLQAVGTDVFRSTADSIRASVPVMCAAIGHILALCWQGQMMCVWFIDVLRLCVTPLHSLTRMPLCIISPVLLCMI